MIPYNKLVKKPTQTWFCCQTHHRQALICLTIWWHRLQPVIKLERLWKITKRKKTKAKPSLIVKQIKPWPCAGVFYWRLMLWTRDIKNTHFFIVGNCQCIIPVLSVTALESLFDAWTVNLFWLNPEPTFWRKTSSLKLTASFWVKGRVAFKPKR